MSEPRLIDMIPDNIQHIGGGWRIIFGDETTQGEIGCVYLLKTHQYYVRFKIVRELGTILLPYEIISKRPLTEEEISHFEALVAGQQ
jgi:hypothetical protein